MIFNQWLYGEHNFSIPPLPPQQIGQVGCNVVRLTFDPAIGEEVCVLFKEDPDYAAQYALETPINMFAHTGLLTSPPELPPSRLAKS